MSGYSICWNLTFLSVCQVIPVVKNYILLPLCQAISVVEIQRFQSLHKMIQVVEIQLFQHLRQVILLFQPLSHSAIHCLWRFNKFFFSVRLFTYSKLLNRLQGGNFFSPTGDRSIPKICTSGEMLSHPMVSHPRVRQHFCTVI